MNNYEFNPKGSSKYVAVIENTRRSRDQLRQINRSLRYFSLRLVPQGRGPSSVRQRGRYFNYVMNAPLSKAPLMALYLQRTDESRGWCNRLVWKSLSKADHPLYIVREVQKYFSPFIVAKATY